MDTPPPEFAQLLAQAVITGSLAVVALGVTAWRGKLSPSVLTSAPDRGVTLQFPDLLGIASLMLLGMVMGSSLFLMIPSEDPIIKAMLIIPVSLLTYAMALAFLFYRLTHQPGEVEGLTEVAETVAADADAPRSRPRWAIGAFGLGAVHGSHLKTAAFATLLALPVVFAANTLMSLFTHLLGGEPPTSGHELLTWFQDTDHKAVLLVLLAISVVVIAPIMEEIIYRGVVQTWLFRLLGKETRWLVLVIASAMFASVHLASVPLEVLPALFLLGVILGWVYETTRSLWPGIMIHALFNAINLTLALLIS